MDALVNSALLTPRYLMKVIDDIPTDIETFRGGDMMPLVTQPGPRIEWDIKKPLGGMTQAVARGAESPLIHRRGVGQMSFEPGHFREKTVLGESDVTTLRKLGTLDQRATAAELISDIVVDLNTRLENRIEWLRWQPIVSNGVTIDSNKVKYSVDYGLPSYLRPTASPAWSSTATADPLTDIQTWMRLVRGSGARVRRFWYNSQVEQYLYQNARILSLIDRVFGGGNTGLMSPAIMDKIFQTYIGSYPTEMYDAGYNEVTWLTTALTAGAKTSFVVNDITGFADGDTVTISDADESWELQTTVNGTPSGSTLTLTSATIPTGGAPVGTMIRAYKTFIPDDKFIIELDFPAGSGAKGEIVSVDAVYGRGSLTNPVPGKFAETMFITKDPKQIEIIAGINALGVVYRKRGWIVADVA